MSFSSMVKPPQMFAYSSDDEQPSETQPRVKDPFAFMVKPSLTYTFDHPPMESLFKPEPPQKDPFLMSEKEAKKAYYEEQCAKYGTRDWSIIKQRQAQERAQRKQEYEARKAVREKREKERAEWWEKNKDRIEREREERRKEKMRVAGERWRRESAAAGKPIPGAWRTANRPDGW